MCDFGIISFPTIIVLGVLIFFHEFGHFLIARLFGVGVEKFSLGFGPRLIGKSVYLEGRRYRIVDVSSLGLRLRGDSRKAFLTWTEFDELEAASTR